MGRTAWRARFHVLGALLLCDAAWATLPDALPVDAQIREGGAAITRDARGMQILQTGEHAIIDWRSFDVGGSVSLRVLQPSAGAALLNRVLGGTASDIAGELSANGQIYLVNPNGIRISPGGAVSAAGFVAATLDITNADFTAGDLRFGSLGQPNAGTVVHAGRITGQPGGFVALLGHRVEQSGWILTTVGQVGLGAGAAMKLTPGQDRFLEVTLAEGAAEGVGRTTPSITLSGRIEADGGLVQISAPMAAARGQAPADAVNLSGIVQARHVFGRTGTILIVGSNGIVRSSGRLDASSNEMRGARRPGGTVEVSGLQVMMEDEGIDVSGALGGGRVRITALNAGPGAGAGDGDGPHSLRDDAVGDPVVFVSAWARINASATYRGSAGNVVLASDGRVVFLGHGQARSANADGTDGVDAADVSGPMQMTVVEDTVMPRIARPALVRMPATAPRLMRMNGAASRDASLPRSLSASSSSLPPSLPSSLPPSLPSSLPASLPPSLAPSPLAFSAASPSGHSAGSSAGSPAGFLAASPAGIPARASAVAPSAATLDMSVLPDSQWPPLPDAPALWPVSSRLLSPDVPSLAPLSVGRTPLPRASRPIQLSIEIPVDPAPWGMAAMGRASNSGSNDL